MNQTRHQIVGSEVGHSFAPGHGSLRQFVNSPHLGRYITAFALGVVTTVVLFAFIGVVA